LWGLTASYILSLFIDKNRRCCDIIHGTFHYVRTGGEENKARPLGRAPRSGERGLQKPRMGIQQRKTTPLSHAARASSPQGASLGLQLYSTQKAQAKKQH